LHIGFRVRARIAAAADETEKIQRMDLAVGIPQELGDVGEALRVLEMDAFVAVGEEPESAGALEAGASSVSLTQATAPPLPRSSASAISQLAMMPLTPSSFAICRASTSSCIAPLVGWTSWRIRKRA
jgi:hypothetical protein